MGHPPEPGDTVEVSVGPVAHGGHCVARHEGQVIFVRGALPGERVVARITAVGRKGRSLHGDVVEVIAPAPGRRAAPCPVADRCGGCDWQHAEPALARALKAEVVQDAFRRFAGIELPALLVRRIPLSSDAEPSEDTDVTRPDRAPEGLGWRTRGTVHVDPTGHAGFLARRSHDVVPTSGCPQLHARLSALDLFDGHLPSGRHTFVAPARGEPAVFAEGRPPAGWIVERAAGRSWRVSPEGFWQVHPGAADALFAEVQRMLEPRTGERLLDLYSGVGLFGIGLAARVPGLRVTCVEGDRAATEHARTNAAGLPVRVVRSGIEPYLASRNRRDPFDLVVLDPPRVGAGERVIQALAGASPRAIAYVACDPVALARDVATAVRAGFTLADVVALDLFPTTHHVECVALLAPTPAGLAPAAADADAPAPR